jgi:carbon-monoxide dehydrogenase iron sulfur subunit
MGKAIIIDIERCLACKSCEIACAVVHSKSGILEKAVREQPKPQRRITVETAGEFAIPLQCRHCEDARCIEICPTGAIRRENEQSPIVVEQDLCIGCKLCMVVCHFGVLQISREGRAILKCDMCLQRTEQGQEPACIEACLTGAMKLVLVEEVTRSKQRAVSGAPVGKSSPKRRPGKGKGRTEKGNR